MKPREDVRAALERLEQRAAAPRALEVDARSRAAFGAARERAASQFAEVLPPVLVVALAGGTGVGKSTLINALAGAPIAVTGAERPTTTRIVVYHHEDVPLGGLPSELGYAAQFVAHRREELYWKVLVDTPDLDSFVREHRERTRALLRSAGLVLYVFSPEKYLEERLWSVLREERRFSASAAVLNKADTLQPDELERVSEDLRARLAGAGLARLDVFCTQAARHAGAREGAAPLRGVDDTPRLRAFLERELQQGDATRIVREGRRRALANLAEAVRGLAPERALESLDALEVLVRARAEEAGGELVALVADELAAIEGELAPLATLRQHERFRGPFRAWLVLADFATIGLSGIVDRLAGRPPRGTANVVQRILGPSRARDVEALVRSVERSLQDELYARGLPVARWHEIAKANDGERVLQDLAREVQERFETRSALFGARGAGLVQLASVLGGLVPAALVLGGLWLLVRDLFDGRYLGLGLALHLAAVVALFFVALHGVVAVCLPTTALLGRGLGLDAARAILPGVLGGWFASYRAELEADLADLAEPLAELEALLQDEVGASPPERASEAAGEGDRALAWPAPEAPAVDARAAEAPLAKARARAAELDPGERLLRALEREPS